MECSNLGIFATNVAPWADHEWPEVFATSPWMGPKAFLVFRLTSALIFLGHAIAHLAWRLSEGDGWFYLQYLTHWALWLEVVSEILLVVVAVRGYNSLNAPRLSGLPQLVRVAMAFYAIILPASLLVVVLYWTLVTPLWEIETADDVPGYLSIFVHFLNWLLILVGLFGSRLPYSLNRTGWAVLFGFLYVLWTIIHFVAQVGTPRPCASYPQQECPIYPAWDWHEPGFPALISFALLLVIPVVGLIYVGFVRCRNGCDPLMRSKAAAEPGENLEEGKTNTEVVVK